MRLAEMRAQGLIETLDEALGETLARVGGASDPEVALAVALASRHVRRGHTCFPLSASPEELWPQSLVGADLLPEASRWAERLRATALTAGGPLVLDPEGRLYLRRYWELEQDVAQQLAARAGRPRALPEDSGLLARSLDRLFGEDEESAQRRAAENALAYRVSLLCGGPGTGKTTTVAAIVALLLERDLWEKGKTPRVLLLAPTGKAAARLGEAVARSKERIEAAAEVLDAIPTEAMTVHRALGMRHEGMRFRRSADLPLEADIVVLDEASMIDLASMRQLLDATPSNATLLIVGDPDQLTSVEAGSVLRDLVDANAQTWWRGRVTHLVKTYRYDETMPLGRLVSAIRAGDAAAVESLLDERADEGVVWRPHDALRTELDRAASFWSNALATEDPDAHFEARGKLVTLTPFRRGPIGTARLGESIEARLRALGGAHRVRPIIIEQNSQELRVFNGDFAMLVGDETPRAVVQSDSGEQRTIAEARLPRYSNAYALSVHKSQGSEFDRVLVMFPEDDAPLLTRELLYTAVSRARHDVRIVGPKEVVLAALARRAKRDSGLVDAIAKVDEGTAADAE